MKSRKLALLLACLSIAVFAGVIYKQTQQHSDSGLRQFAQDMEIYAELGGNFSLNTVAGKTSLAELWEGKIVLLSFGFTRCPDICPTSLITMQEALRQLTTAERQAVQVVFVSVDPEYDTPKRVADYVRFFIDDAIGMSDSVQATEAATQSYGAFFGKVLLPDSELGYTVDHTTRWYLIQASGKIGTVFDHNLPPTDMANIISVFARNIPR